jgi:hypothetical protein
VNFLLDKVRAERDLHTLLAIGNSGSKTANIVDATLSEKRWL